MQIYGLVQDRTNCNSSPIRNVNDGKKYKKYINITMISVVGDGF